MPVRGRGVGCLQRVASDACKGLRQQVVMHGPWPLICGCFPAASLQVNKVGVDRLPGRKADWFVAGHCQPNPWLLLSSKSSAALVFLPGHEPGLGLGCSRSLAGA